MYLIADQLPMPTDCIWQTTALLSFQSLSEDLSVQETQNKWCWAQPLGEDNLSSYPGPGCPFPSLLNVQDPLAGLVDVGASFRGTAEDLGRRAVAQCGQEITQSFFGVNGPVPKKTNKPSNFPDKVSFPNPECQVGVSFRQE